MFTAAKRLFLGLALIACAAGILLLSDLEHRNEGRNTNAADSTRIPRVALFVIASNALLEDAGQGVAESLTRANIVDGKTANIDHFNAEGDLPTANSIAKNIVNGGYDMVITLSTPALQTMAAANTNGTVTHIFGAVTDPFSAGVGINSDNPRDHPPYLAGIGTFQPVANTLDLLHYIAPHVQTLGIVWNPAEACSEACTLRARNTAKRLGWKVIEAQVENTAGVFEAATSLVARGADCFYVGGDNTVSTGIQSLVKAASAGRVPVITNTPSDAVDGVAMALGANYVEVGRRVGKMAAQVVRGELDPADVAIEDVVPPKLTINKVTLGKLKQPWTIPPAIMACASLVVDASGEQDHSDTAKPVPHFKNGQPVWPAETPETKSAMTETEPRVAPITRPLGKKWRLRFLDYVEADHVTGNHEGFFKRVKELGLVEGRDYEIVLQNAQGDMATLNTMVSVAASDRPDLVLLTSTPTLQAVVQKIHDIPVIFSNVSNPIIAGAGKTDEDHLPNVTGIYSGHDFPGMVKLVRHILPNARTVGTLYCPAEANSEFNAAELLEAAQAAGLKCFNVASTASSEVPQTAQALIDRGVDAICQVADNMHDTAFTAIAQAARRTKTPLFTFVPGLARERGAAVALAKDYSSAGHDQAELMLRIMQGADPADIPFRPIRLTELIVNLDNAKHCGFEIPADVVAEASEVIGGDNGKP